MLETVLISIVTDSCAISIEPKFCNCLANKMSKEDVVIFVADGKVWRFKKRFRSLRLAQVRWIDRQPPRFYPFIVRRHNRMGTYPGQSWHFWFVVVCCRKSDRMRQHRDAYGTFWRPRTAWLYPAYQGHPRRNQQGAKSRYSINMEMSKASYSSDVRCSRSTRIRCVEGITIQLLWSYINRLKKIFFFCWSSSCRFKILLELFFLTFVEEEELLAPTKCL